jgi:hypothetical protein
MSKPKAQDRDLPLELIAEDCLFNLFDSDTWQPGLVEADPAKAARLICDCLRSSGFAIVNAEARENTMTVRPSGLLEKLREWRLAFSALPPSLDHALNP